MIVWLGCTIGGVAAGLSAGLVYIVREVAARRALLDRPNERSSHSVPRPRLGGIGIVLPLIGVGLLLAGSGIAPSGIVIPMVATGGVALLGLLDDLRPLPARTRFGVQVLLAVVVVATAWDRLPHAAGWLGQHVPGPLLGVGAVLWIVWLTNLYNFMDGIDGIAGTQALVAALGLAVIATRGGSEAQFLLLLALAAASAGFLVFNFPPSSIFMGDVGSTAIGFFFGVLPLLPPPGVVTLEPVALSLSLFVLDATSTLLRRMVAGEKWHTPHRSHLYQRPVVRGVAHRPVLLVAAGGMVVVAGGAIAWEGATASGKLAIAAMPFLLFGAAHAFVRNWERNPGPTP